MSHPNSLSLEHNPYAEDYSNHSRRKAFKKLPIMDQLLVEAVHWDEALKMERSSQTVANTQTAVNTAMEQTPTEMTETTLNTVELDSENYGAPPENSGIEINAKKASNIEPQAWEDKHGNWFYNFAGALRLAEVLGRTLPSGDQLAAAINANPDNFRQYAGWRDTNGKFYEHGKFSTFWSSSEKNRLRAYCVSLGEESLSQKCPINRRSGFSIRFIRGRK